MSQKRFLTRLMCTVISALILLTGCSRSSTPTKDPAVSSPNNTSVYYPSDNQLYYFSSDGINRFSSNHNVIVFLLDRLDYDCIIDILEEQPDFFDRLDGFTSYSNAISEFARTEPAANHIITGYEDNVYLVPSHIFLDKSWKAHNNDLLKTIKNAGYTTEMYSEIFSLFGTPVNFAPYVNNITWNEEQRALWEYKIDDTVFSKNLSELQITSETKSFKFYHLNGAHAPYKLNSDGNKSDVPTSRTEQTMGCFNILYNIFDQMKNQGIYKDSEIIIVADHGEAISDRKPLTKATAIGLFHKPSGVADIPMVQSTAPVSHKNIAPTILKAMGISNYTDYGQPLDEIDENANILRYFYKSVIDDTRHEKKVYKYEITGNALEFKNWKIIEEFDVLYYFY